MAKGENSGDGRNKLLEEHRELVKHVSDLDEWATAPPGGDWGKELGRRAATVTEQLRQHFAGDAEGTFFADVARHAPHLTGKLSKLVAEHAEILTRFREVAELGAAHDGSDAAESKRLATQARRAVAILRRHEAEENELVFHAFWDDLGVGD